MGESFAAAAGTGLTHLALLGVSAFIAFKTAGAVNIAGGIENGFHGLFSSIS